jgi:hypothetical protein
VISSTLLLQPDPSLSWGSFPIPFTFYMTTTDWDPDTVTWNTRPNLNTSLPIQVTFYDDDDLKYVYFDPFAEQWLENDASNYGFIFGPTSSAMEYGMGFYSGEYDAVEDFRPALQVVYNPASSVEEKSWGAIKALE